MSGDIEVGDAVKTIGFFAGIEAVVTKIRPGKDFENHGCIELQVTKTSNKGQLAHLSVGDVEHFVHFEWFKNLTILKKRD